MASAWVDTSTIANMETLKFLSFFILLACIISSSFAGPLEGRESIKADPISEQAALELLEKYDVDYSRECNKEMVARWAYITNVTTENEQAAVSAQISITKLIKSCVQA